MLMESSGCEMWYVSSCGMTIDTKLMVGRDEIAKEISPQKVGYISK